MTTATKPCDLFPMLGAAEFEALKRDIAEHGQREAILCVDGEIVDGRNRMRACEELGIEPIVRNLSADEAGDVFALVMSLNFYRRHLTPKDRGDALKGYMAQLGAAPGDAKAGRPSKESAHSGPISINAVADKLNIPRTTAQRAIKASDDYEAASPENQAKVDAGELTPKQARVATEKAAGKPPAEKPTEPKAPRERDLSDVLSEFETKTRATVRALIEKFPSLRAPLAGSLRFLAHEVQE